MTRAKGPSAPPEAFDASLACIARGWSVVPVRAREKAPLVRWDDFQRRPATPVEVRAWFQRWPDAGLAVVTGLVSGLAVVDVDPRHGGAESLAALEREHGALPATCEVATGGGGRHLYFRLPETPLGNRVSLAPGIDLRARGGLAIAPPSMHASGRRYRWRPGRSPDETAPAPMPTWVVELARTDRPRRGHPLEFWRDLVRGGVTEGERNARLTSLAGHLLWHGVDPEVALELLLCWNRERCRPPLEDAEVARTVASIARLHSERGDLGDEEPA